MWRAVRVTELGSEWHSAGRGSRFQREAAGRMHSLPPFKLFARVAKTHISMSVEFERGPRTL